jgi:hypothetical protein
MDGFYWESYDEYWQHQNSDFPYPLDFPLP